jgi:ATP-dependent Clp protease ATP-binding subunit ClpB
LGSDLIAQYEGDRAAQEKAVDKALRARFKPEFLNRIDDIIIFQPLQKEEIRAVVAIQIEKAKKRLADKQIDITVTAAALDSLAAAGYDPVYGARPLKRLIQTSILDPLSLKIIWKCGYDALVIDAHKNKHTKK